jgi:hypothetical protein
MIEDTTGRDPLIHLIGGLGGLDGYVGEMEQRGQEQLVHSDRLPVELNSSKEEDFLAAGFTFGEPDPQDPLFRPATLPEGWKREGMDHSMWSQIVDHKGRQRVRIFYKAAFYDRRAFMSLVSPLEVLSDLFEQDIKELPIDDWRTRELWVELLTKQHAKLVADAADAESWSSQYAFRYRKQAEICAEQLAKMQAGE